MPVAICWLPETYGSCKKQPSLEAGEISKNGKELVLYKNNNSIALEGPDPDVKLLD
jgi:hypothetical protein